MFFCILCINLFTATVVLFLFINKGSLKRKSEVGDLTNTNQQIPNTIAFNFASSTPALITTNKQSGANISK